MSVEFQLVGNLTLRQFGYLALGAMLTFLIYILPLTDWLKWPLLISVATFFAALTWLPVNDMGLDRWVVAFFRAINSPTKRIWRKDPKELAIFTRDFSENLLRRSVNPPGVSDRTKLNEYLATLRASAPKSDLDRAEASYLESLPFEEGGPAPKPMAPLLGSQPTVSLASETLPPPATPPAVSAPEAIEVPEPRTIEEDLTKPSLLQPTIKPVITVHMPHKNIYVKKVSTTSVNRQLHSLSSLEGTIVLPVRGEKTFEISADLKNRLYPAQDIAEVGQAGLNPAPPIEVSTAPALAPVPPVQPAAPAPPEPQLVYNAPPVPGTPQAPTTDVSAMEKKLAAEAEATRTTLQQPKAAPAAPQAASPAPAPAPSPSKEAPVEKLKPSPTSSAAPDRSTDSVKLPTEPPKPIQTSGSVTGATPAIGKMAPLPANVPNVIVGLLRDQSGLLITDAVIIVKDAEGEPVRALKSNKVGQFAISTPLPNGKYTIDIQKDGYRFDTIAVDLAGQIFAPIEIKAT